MNQNQVSSNTQIPLSGGGGATWYLEKIHYVLMIGLVHSTLFYFYFQWYAKHYKQDISRYVSLGIVIIMSTLFYFALSIVVKKWKSPVLAMITFFFLEIIRIFFLKENQQLIFWFHLLTDAIPLAVFLITYIGWHKKLIIVIIAYWFTSAFSTLAGSSTNSPIIRSIFYPHQVDCFFYILFTTVSFVFQIILIGETINFLQNKAYQFKTRLINLENQTNKLNTFIVFFVLHIIILLLLIGIPSYFPTIRYYQSASYLYFRLNIIRTFISLLLMSIFYAWYFRKFMIESFVNLNIRSKIIYWLCFIPIIGLFTFLIVLLIGSKNNRLKDRVENLNLFAGSSNVVITSIIIFYYCCRLILNLQQGNAGEGIIILILSIILFWWFIANISGYYVKVSLSILILIGSFIILYIKGNNHHNDMIYFLFDLLVMNLIYTIILLPVYHFDKFEYIPDYNADETFNENNLITK